MNFYVYEHVRRDTGAAFYVGKGRGMRAHKLGASYGRSAHHGNIVKKSGKPFVVVVQRGMSEHGAFCLERERIAYHRSNGTQLVNRTEGGEGASGYVHSPAALERMKARVYGPEMRAKMSAAAKKRISDPEARDKMRAAVGSPEARAKIGVANKGHVHTAETRARISATATGKVHSTETRAKMTASQKARHARRPKKD